MLFKNINWLGSTGLEVKKTVVWAACLLAALKFDLQICKIIVSWQLSVENGLSGNLLQSVTRNLDFFDNVSEGWSSSDRKLSIPLLSSDMDSFLRLKVNISLLFFVYYLPEKRKYYFS